MNTAQRRELMVKLLKDNFLMSDLEIIDLMIKEGAYDRTSRQHALQTIWGVRRAVAVGKDLRSGQAFHWHVEAPQYVEPPSEVNYLKGDATNPEIKPNGNTVIVHCCNDIGAWGAGFVMAISKRWPQPEKQYHDRCMAAAVSGGYVMLVPVEPGLIVANVIGQSGVYSPSRPNSVPVRYNWLEAGFTYLGAVTKMLNVVEWVMPRLGCGLAKGDWGDISRIIARRLSGNINVYDLP